MDDLGIHRIVIDRPAANRIVAGFLAKLGHRIVALPDAEAGTLKDVHGRDPEVFQKAGITRLLGLLEPGEEAEASAAAGRRYAERLAAAVRTQGVTAAWIYDDETAGYMLGRLAELGVRVPADLTLLGFDGITIGEAFCPPLTTIAVPVADMVARVCGILNAPEESTGSRTHIFQPVLLERRSHGVARST
jgi:DNA-binding LacI/PurR family transcriptional regulator